MNREELMNHIQTEYSVDPEYLWVKYPSYCVFRHPGSRKWFALVADVPSEKLGLPAGKVLSLVVVKCDPILIGSLLAGQGFYPAYHMSKDNWISAALDGSVEAEKMTWLVGHELRSCKAQAKNQNAHSERYPFLITPSASDRSSE